MKTYLLYQNGKLIMKEKQENKNKKKVSKLIPNLKKQQQQPQQQIIQPKHISQKERSLIAPPLIESLKNTHVSRQSTVSTKNSSQQNPAPPKQSGGKKIKASELQLDLFSKLCKIINIDSANPLGNDIPFEKLQDDNVIKKLYDIQEKLKDAFPSSKLTALHTNALKKQSFPGVNIVRQIFKEMGYKLRPINTSEGYVGRKKILRRVYHIDKL
jgi:hypothetical protein